MEEMRRIAYETVLRACGFASLAIFCVMIGLSFLPRSAFQAGGFLSMLMTLVLVLKAHEARTKDHRRTEMWLYLPKESRPPQALAQKTISTLMRETYLLFARWTAHHLHCDVDDRAAFLRSLDFSLRLHRSSRVSAVPHGPTFVQADYAHAEPGIAEGRGLRREGHFVRQNHALRDDPSMRIPQVPATAPVPNNAAVIA